MEVNQRRALEYQYDELKMVGTDTANGSPVHPLTVWLMDESKKVLDKAAHRK